MIDLGEHIEELIKINERERLPNDPDSIAEAVLDIAFSQGLLTAYDEVELELAHKQVADQARYLLGVS